MRLLSWLRTRKPVGKRRKSVARLRVEHLEDRRCPAGYAITDLGALGGTTSWANAINNAGQVVGNAQTAGGLYHPFLYSGGVMTDLAPSFNDNCGATAINDSGQVVVSAGSLPTFNNAFLWTSSTGLTDLGHLPNSSVTIARALDNATAVHGVQVVGESWLASGGMHAFLWQDSSLSDLNDPNLYP